MSDNLRAALDVIAADHNRESLHDYIDPEHRGTLCRSCDALATLAALASPSPEPLDVERLAKALEREGVPVDLGTRYPFSPGDAKRAAYRDLAARLSEESR